LKLARYRGYIATCLSGGEPSGAAGDQCRRHRRKRSPE
jgi:hypothetical protein